MLMARGKAELIGDDVLPVRHWYAVYSTMRDERLAHDNLKHQGFMTFYPFRRVKRRRKLPTGQHRIEIVEVALMPRYLFVLVEEDGISAVNDTIGVATIVCTPFGRKALKIPDGVMDRFMSYADQDVEDRTKVEFAGKPGDKFEFSDESPFRGLLATIKSLDGLDNRNEIVAELEMLGSERSIPVPLSAVGKFVA